jgi:death-on-curing protein
VPIRFLSLTDVLQIHANQLAHYGGPSGVRDQGALTSAVNMPQAGAFGHLFHSSLSAMAAAYLFHIVQGHPFVDGNKRTGLAAAAVFLRANGYVLPDTLNDELEHLTLRVAMGEASKDDVAQFLQANMEPLE